MNRRRNVWIWVVDVVICSLVLVVLVYELKVALCKTDSKNEVCI